MAGISRIHGGLDAYVESANTCIVFKLIKREEELEDDSVDFYPEFTHQFFGDSECIYGYTGLKVEIFYTASRLLPVFRMSYKSSAKRQKRDDLEPDNVMKIICDKLEMALPTNLDVFVASLDKENTFRPYGKLINSFEVENEYNSKENYEIYRCDMSTPGFREYHQRMQTFILWFIDAASFIDVDDDRWEYFLVFQRGIEYGDPRYYFVGYATVYRYYAYPTKVRPRISQMLVLPPFQKRGVGAELLQGIYDWYICDSDVLDITVEDPSENFTRLRDYVDCKNCLKLSSFQKEKLIKGFSPVMVKEAQEKFKICKKQARRVYEILRLKITNTSDKKEYKTYRLDVKQRLNAPFQRQKLDMEKMKKSLTPEELAATISCTTSEQRMEQLCRSYEELEEEYKQVIERLEIST